MKKALIFIGLVATLVSLVLLSRLDRGRNAVEVELAEAELGVIRSSILASGTLAYREQVQLRSEVIAQVAQVHVRESDRVEKGQLVISLVTENFDAQVEQAAAQVRVQAIAIERQKLLIDNLARRYRNAEELVREQLVDEDSYENLRNELAIAQVGLRSQQESLSQARAALDQAEEVLSRTRIISPIDGIVIRADVKAGETVIAGTTNIPGSTLMVIADPSEMLVEVRVDEADIAQVREGQRADIFAAAFPDTPLVGTVESIAPTAQQAPGQQSLSFLVKILLEDQDALAVRSGMSARAEIYTESSEETLAVPIQAVQYDDDAGIEEGGEEMPAFVFVVEDGTARRRDVEIGISSDEEQEIRSGLEVGDTVVSGPFRALRDLQDGDPVEARENDDGPETDPDERFD
jgi:HlyD family secretion protein